MDIRGSVDIAPLLRQARRAKGWSQLDLANHIGVSRQWVVSTEAGAPTAHIDLVFRALHAVGLRVNLYEDTSQDLYDAVLANLR
jgi:DNA-binding XRE family transcriptional regulator